MIRDFDFNKLFIFDLANNHYGNLKHAVNIISALCQITRDQKIRGALKFQFRDPDTFIHPDFLDCSDLPHIPRFLATRLAGADYRVLTEAVRDNGMITMATPFDEPSVDLIEELAIEVIKIASCSSFDWPLLDRVTKSDKPVVISTAGLSLSKIDPLAYYFKNRK